jgi:peptidoglycan/LPS O-acetylase OafA/YrhL
MRRIPQLDAIRGFAVLAVLAHNTDKTSLLGGFATNGWMGVDLFFVLSGFLITGILLDTKGSEVYFRNFYARRCLRIWPLYYAVLIFMFVMVPHLRPSEGHQVFEARSMPWWSYFIFVQNFLVPVPTQAMGALGVTWSLAVEEQFYLVWPLLVYFCSPGTLRKVAGGVIVASPLLRFYLEQRRHFDIYPNTFCRLDALMFGALIASLLREKWFASEKYVRPAWWVLAIALPLAIYLDHAFHQRWIVFSFTAAASAAFVYLALCSKQKLLKALLTNRFLVYAGTISYGIYLLSKIPSDAAKSFHLDNHPALVLLLTAAATFVLATLSWNLLEKPCLRLKRYFLLERKPQNVSEGNLVGAS